MKVSSKSKCSALRGWIKVQAWRWGLCVTIYDSLQFLIVALAIVGLALAAEKDGEATIVDGSEKVAEYFNANGYDYKFKTSNTIVKQEQLDLTSNIVTGEYEYVDPDGELLKSFDKHNDRWLTGLSSLLSR